MNASIDEPQQRVADNSWSGESAGGQGGIIDFGRILRGLRKRLWLVIVVAVLLSALAITVIFQLTPKYTASVTLIQQQRNIAEIEGGVEAAIRSVGAGVSRNEIIKSTEVASRVVTKLNLLEDPEFNPELRPAAPFSVGRIIGSIKNALGLGGTSSQERPELTVPELQAQREIVTRKDPVRRAANILIENTEIGGAYASSVFVIEYTAKDPEKAAIIANAIADAYITDQLEAQFQAAEMANRWFQDRTAELREEVQQAERAVELYRQSNDLSQLDGQTLDEQQLSEMNAELISARAELAAREVRYQRAREVLGGSNDLDRIAELFDSSTIQSLRRTEGDLARQQAELLTRYGPRHPAIVNLQAERSDLDAQIRAEARRRAL